MPTLADLALHEFAMDSFFVAHRLAQLRQERGQTPKQQAEALGISLDTLVKLALCRMPPESDGAALVRTAAEVGMDAGRLAEPLSLV